MAVTDWEGEECGHVGTQSVQWLRRLINAKQKRVGGRKGLFWLTVQGDGAHYRGENMAA